jgi:NAD(P)-dependent dehydrogenase (short-subunit alcohol dehydrogenase family)
MQPVSFDHSGHAVIVTGAGSGIGRATARRLADEGAAVAVWDVNAQAALETTGLIEAAGGRAVAITADVRDRGSVQAGRQDTLAAFEEPLRYLVNNAGLVRMSSLEDLTDEEWDLVLDTNLKGMYVVTQELFRTIAENGGGAIVNLSTIEAEVVVSSRGYPQPHYNASKGGVKMLTKAMAVELAKHGIRVNAVAPGAIATGFVPGADWKAPEAWDSIKDRLLVPRVGEPEDVAATISFLLSGDASYVTGVQLPVDGGWLTR